MEGLVITKINIKPYKSMYEFKQAGRLILNEINFEYEPTKIYYGESVNNAMCDECGSGKVTKTRSYTPDFWFPKSNIYVETKGKFTPENRTRMMNVCAQSSLEIRIVFMTDNWLSKKHSMKYSRWCELNNIKYAIGDVPLSWVEADANDSNNST